MSVPTYNSNARVMALSESVAADPLLQAIVWNRLLEMNSNTEDDFAKLEGESGSLKPFWRKQDLAAGGGDKVIFTTIGEVSGPGVRGEKELTGNTSKAQLGTYECRVDYWRDAVELTAKQIRMIATGKSLESVLLGMLGKKLGRQKMYDMMQTLIKKASGNILRPNRKKSRNELAYTDSLTTTLLVESKAKLQGQGGRAVNMTKSPSGSPVYHYLVFAGQDAMMDIRNSTSFQSALHAVAAATGSGSEQFSGKLVDWQGLYIWEHTVVDPDSDDVIGSPLAPKALLGLAVTADDTAPLLKANPDNTLSLYFSFFPGFDWQWIEDQVAAPDSGTYYAWIVNPGDAVTDAGLAGFYSYLGTGTGTGNTLQTNGRMRSFAATAFTVSSVVSGTYTVSSTAGLTVGDTFQLGSVVGGTGTGVTASTTYYVKTIPNGTTFTAAATASGSAFTGSATSAQIIAHNGAFKSLGQLTWSDTYNTDIHGVGSFIIPANSQGVPVGYSFVFGAGAALRANGGIDEDSITQKRDYGFVKGFGYQSIFGQCITKDTKGKPRHYLLLEHAIEHPGIIVPYLGYAG